MSDITDRQSEILASIVEAYAKTAEPVGSLILSERFGLSPATLRAEMAELERQGYVIHPHTSAGRYPTDKGYRWYVNQIQSDQLPSRAAYAIERQIQDSGEAEQAIKNSARLLAEATRNLGVATWSHEIHRFGLASLFSHPEFYGGPQAYEVARMIDDLPELLEEISSGQNRVTVYIGHEHPIGKSAGASSIIGRVRTPFGQNYIGLIGPTRQDYGTVIGLVDYVSHKLEESLNV